MDGKIDVKGTVEAVTGLVEAVPVYEDAFQPLAKQLGKSLETVGKLVNVALAPVSALIWGYDRIENFIQEKVPQKLINVPQEDIITPNPHVAAPLIEALRYTGNNEELREMFANLLANSMDKNTATKAHPAYVDIIKNITSDEAKLVKYFSKNNGIAAMEMICYTKGQVYETIARNIINIDSSEDYENDNLIPCYIDNLCRLGLLETYNDRQDSEYEKYNAIKDSFVAAKYIEEAQKKYGGVIEFREKLIQLTDFGNQFIEVCVEINS